MLCGRLKARRSEIERNLLNRLKSIADSDAITDPEYVDGLPAAIAAGLTYALEVVGCSERHMPPIPAVLLSQARLAARNGLTVDTVARRYSACRTHIGEVLTAEAEEAGLVERVKLSDLLRVQGVRFDELLCAVLNEYRRESDTLGAPEMRRLTLVRRLLAGESLDASELRYDLGAHHLAVIARGSGATSVIKGLAVALNSIPLTVCNADGAIWAWLGRSRPHDVPQIEELVTTRWPERLHLAMGEPALGEIGWRQTHEQASAAFLVSLHRPGTLSRYADDPLLFSAMRDNLLGASLHDLYLVPLKSGRDGGKALRQTLRAYLDAGCNGASAAHALDVSRQTVKNRIQTVEARVGRPVADCTAELKAALRLADIRPAQIK